MNRMQRYSKRLVDANNDVGERRGAALIWRGQAIERIQIPELTDVPADTSTRWPAPEAPAAPIGKER